MQEMFEIVKVGGPVAAVTALFLVFMDRDHRRTNTTLNNHLNHLNETLNKNNILLEKLSGLIARLSKGKSII